MKYIRDKQIVDRFLELYHIDAYFSDFEAYRPYFCAVTLKRQDFFMPGEVSAPVLYFYVKGRFKLYIECEDGRRKLLRFCEGPMMLGDAELLRRDDQMSTCIEAVDHGLMIVLDYTQIREKLLTDTRLLYCICESLAEKMYVFGSQQTVNAVYTADEKVWEYIRQKADGRGIFKVNLRTAAEELDISYRHLHRILKSLIEKKKLARTEDGYRILE